MTDGDTAPDAHEIKFLPDTRVRLTAAPGATTDILDEFERQANEFARLSEVPFVVPTARSQKEASADMGGAVRLLVGSFRHAAHLRHAALAADFIEAANARRVFGVALSGRAILETASASAHHYKGILGGARKFVEAPHDFAPFGRAMFQAVAGSRFDWERDDRRMEGRPAFLEEFAKTAKGSPFGEATNILTMLEALREDVEARAPGNAKLVGHAYGKLSDICHPAFGGYSIFGSADEQWIELSRAHAGGHAIILASEMLPALTLASTVSLDRLRRLAAFAE